MNILLVTEYFPTKEGIVTGGVERRTVELAKHLAQKCTVTILAARTSPETAAEIPGLRVIRCGPRRFYTHNSALIDRMRMLFAIVHIGRRLQVDVIEASNASVYIAGWLIGARKNIARVIWVPDVLGFASIRSLGFFKGSAALIADAVGIRLPWDQWIALSQQTAKKLICAGISEKSIAVVYGGTWIAPERTTIRRGHTVLCVSRLVDYKHVSDLIAAFDSVQPQIPDAQLIVIGTGPLKRKLLAQALGIGKAVTFIDSVSDGTLKESYSKAAVFVHCSTFEGFGLATLEAMSVGTPFVITDIPVHREVTNGKGGLFFQPRDVSDLSKKLLLLLSDGVLWDTKSQEASEVAQRYSWKRIADQTVSIYNDAVKR